MNELNFTNPNNHLNLENIYIGAQSDLVIKQYNLKDNELKVIKINCLNFYIELCKQIKSRFNFKHTILQNLNILNPVVATSGEIESITEIIMKFPNIDVDIEAVNNEFRMLSVTESIKEKNRKSIGEFWYDVFQLKNASNESYFPHLEKIIVALLALPHSSAAAERIFSQLNLFKNKLSNRLSIETCTSLIFTKQMLDKNSCFDFVPTKELLNYNINTDADNVIENEDLSF